MNPTPEQLAAIEAFAAKHGRYWKAELRLAWETGIYPRGAAAGLLQQVRNQLGPTWLTSFRLEKK